MAEGVAVAERQVAAGVYDNPDAPPPADPQAAPYGWVWRRGASAWTAAKRRPKPGTRREAELAAAQVFNDSMSSTSSTGPGAPPTAAAAPGHQDQDPAPGWAADGQPGPAPDDSGHGTGRSSAAGKLRFDEVPQQVKDDIAGLAGLVATPILSLLQAVDPYCGTILAQNFEPVVDATLPLICRSERIVRYFQEDTADWLLWGKLAIALKPFAQAVVEHHILGRVEVIRDPKTGQVTIEHRERSGGPGPGHDHLTPQPQPAYAA